MVVLATCKNEEDPIKSDGARVFTALYISFSDAQWQITPGSVVFELIQTFMHVFVICKNEDDSIKMEELE